MRTESQMSTDFRYAQIKNHRWAQILIVEPNWVGDTLFTTPFIRALREANPSAYIASLIHPRAAEILKGNPRLNEIILFDEAGRDKGILGKLRLIRQLKKGRFDCAFLLHRSFTRALLIALAGVPHRIGYWTRKRGWLLTCAIEPPIEDMHRVEYFLNIARQAGIPVDDKGYEFFPSEEDKRYIKDFLKDAGLTEGDFLVVLNPGGNWGPKRWPYENYAHLADALSERFGAKIIITGAKKDSCLAESLASLMKTRPIVAAGSTTLGQLGALMARAKLVVSGDSGPMHIAVSQGAKVIALFGPTSPAITGPYGRGKFVVIQKDTGCEVPCYDLTCTDNRCMKAIGVEDVLAALPRLGLKALNVRSER